MPIDIEEFEHRPEDALDIKEGTQPFRVLSFLSTHDERAFTQTEIAEGTGISRGSVGAVLSRLEERGLVRHRGRYWAVGEDDRLAAFAAGDTASAGSIEDDYYG